MKQLSGLDNLFLTLDQGTQYMHVGGLGIYDPSSAPGGKVRFKSVLDFFAQRIGVSKLFRRRLVTAPFGLDRPYWVEDGDVDIEYHVRHIALPHPGDWRQLMIQVARIHSRPLDMSKPLWEAYIIEGLDNVPGIPADSFALYSKIHHAAIDGEAGVELLRAIHSLTPDYDSESSGTALTIVADREPAPIELYARAVGHRAQQVAQAWGLAASLGLRAAAAGRDMLRSGQALSAGRALLDRTLRRTPATPDTAPETGGGRLKPITRFDDEVSAHRVVDAVGFPLADCHKIRQHIDGVTINDIFMTAVGGALREYLDARHELPAETLNAMVPLTTRSSDKSVNSAADGGNQIGLTALPLHTDLADPLARLLKVRRSASKGKALSAALGKDLPARLVNVLPAGLAARLMRGSLTALANVTVSNVRGPDVPLYMAGAQLQLFLPVSIPFSGLGLNITGFSYNGTLWVCFVSCREMLPDPADFAQNLNSAFEALVKAAIAVGPRAGTHAAAARQRRASANRQKPVSRVRAKRKTAP